LRAAAEKAGVALTEIGTVTAGEEVRFTGPGGDLLSFGRASFSHF